VHYRGGLHLFDGATLRCEPHCAFTARQDFMEERDDKETRLAGLRLSISVALAVIIFALAVLAGLAWRRHSGSARLAHPARALQQTNPISGR
jgi:hypothetical protein